MPIQIRLAWVGIALAILGLGACSRVTQQSAIHPAAQRSASTDSNLKARRVYRFSVIPGGAYSSEELARARRVDTVVRTHYSDFGEVITSRKLPADTYVYVSYRKANHVFWTARKHRIPKGELVLTDGKHLARTRCGNRLSLTPQQPTLPDKQSPEETLNDLEAPQNVSLGAPASPLFDTEYDFVPPPFTTDVAKPPALSSSLPTAFASGMNNLLSPYSMIPGFLLGGGGAVPATPAAGTGGSGGSAIIAVPTAIVPEPFSAGLFIAAAFAMLLFSIRKSSKR